MSMEFSSPLAAMRPQPCLRWPQSNNLQAHTLMQGCSNFGSAFDFRNMSMQQRQTVSKDYFGTRPARGSSPTASLTADLDANFHIDKSPQLATPRRALFTANVSGPMQIRVETPPVENEGTSNGTPQIASSSPAADMMDVSPLPHKPPYFVAQLTLPSPTPEETPDEAVISPDLLSPIDLAPILPPPSHFQLPERKRPLTRPTLSRTKGWSSSNILQRPQSAVDTLPPFRFGNVSSTVNSSSSTPTLMESFQESPGDATSTSAARRTSVGSANRVSGSPCSTTHSRRSSNARPPFSRPPRKQMRRSLSMFQHPDDVMKEEQEIFEPKSQLMSMIEVEAEYTQKLPHFIPDDEPDSLPRITQDTMVDILDQKYSQHFQNILIIDCRFEYEYEGGHIENAINFNDKQMLAEKLFAEPAPSTLIIFHCEYSVHRAPLTARHIRSHDRNINVNNYPNLTYPEMYILDGGYSRFFSEHRSKCQPQNYVEMGDTRHEQACERGMARVKQRQKLFRHQTFAFGQNTDMDDSPTQLPTRSNLVQRSQSTFDVGPDLGLEAREHIQRRMASY